MEKEHRKGHDVVSNGSRKKSVQAIRGGERGVGELK